MFAQKNFFHASPPLSEGCLCFISYIDHESFVSLDSLPHTCVEFDPWVNDLGLFVLDREALVEGDLLSANHI